MDGRDPLAGGNLPAAATACTGMSCPTCSTAPAGAPQRLPDLPDVLGALESGRLAPHAFDHRAHVFAAWVAMRRDGTVAGAARFRHALQAYCGHLGAADKYHATVTEALLRLIAAELAAEMPAALRWQRQWRAFERRAAHLLAGGRAALAPYYSEARLALPAARRRFLAPDRQPLPPTVLGPAGPDEAA